MGCGLRKEIESMLRLTPGGWELKLFRSFRGCMYTYAVQRRAAPFSFGVTASGATKAGAMRELLRKWRDGAVERGLPECPAGSREELKLKTCVYGRGP